MPQAMNSFFRWIDRISRDENTMGIVAAIISLACLVGFIAAVAWFANHNLPIQ